ncbi:MAG: hypothetical protein JWM31_2482 [Solirubrobacterales bacterium]|nr:hypothetical protein [Solirubrobacterales bacterium]
MTPVTRRARVVLGACLITLLSLLSGCSDVAKTQDAQQAVLRYEQRIGVLNTEAAAAPATTPSQLQKLVRRYRAVVPPAVMRPPARRLARALSSQLRAAREGLAATGRGDEPGVAAAQAALRRGQRGAVRAVAQITARANRCRATLTACEP